MLSRVTGSVVVGLAAVLCMSVGPGAGAARADVPPEVSPDDPPAEVQTERLDESSEVDEILAELDSDDHRRREAQTHRLLADDSLSQADLAAMLERASTPEQRHRLLAVARHHTMRLRREQMFDQRDSGSMGIRFRMLDAGDLPVRANAEAGGRSRSVEVVFTVPGFPAHAHLQPGDRIIAIDGEPLPVGFTENQFRSRVVNRRAGDAMRVTVQRGRETLDRTLVLGPTQAMNAMYDDRVAHGLRRQFEDEWRQVHAELLEHLPGADPIELADRSQTSSSTEARRDDPHPSQTER